jgi:hypothetical protein
VRRHRRQAPSRNVIRFGVPEACRTPIVPCERGLQLTGVKTVRNFRGTKRPRESNPNEPSENNSTDSDTSRTEPIQNHCTKSGCDEPPADAKPKDATDQIHFPDTSYTSLCAPGVPGKNHTTDSLPADHPPVVINGIRNWHHLPEQIRSVIEILLKTFERARAAEPKERRRR